MDRPLEIAFHNLQVSESLDAEIRQHVDRLEARYGNFVGARVSVEALHQQHQTGNGVEVHIKISLPGRKPDVAVSFEPHHAKERHAHPDIRNAVKDAFRAAEKQLEAATSRERAVSAAGASR